MEQRPERRRTVSVSGLPRTGGQYRIYDPIGAGGMATVHLARFLGTGGFARTVAVKRPLPALQASQEFRRLALREALLAARVHHPHVVSTLDVVDADGELLIVMEYVAGEPLSALMERMRCLGRQAPLPVVTAIIGGALRGLSAVHAARDERGQPLGLIHRDVSPQNILVGVDGLARLADFGLARATGVAPLSNPAEFKGKLTYASPEQVELLALTPATDIYSMGVVLWELLTGQRLYRQLTTPELVARLLASDMPRPSEVVPDLPAALDALVVRALSRDREGRHASALAMAVELEGAVRGASPEEVSGWLHELASQSLDERTQRVVAAESDTAPSERSGVLTLTPPPRRGRAMAALRDGAARAASLLRAASWRVMLASVGVIVAWGSGDWLRSRGEPLTAHVVSRPAEDDRVQAPRSADGGSAAMANEPRPGESIANGRRSRGFAHATGSLRTSAAPLVAEPAPAELRRKAALAKRPTAAPAVECSPPFSLDSQGIRHMKPGCK